VVRGGSRWFEVTQILATLADKVMRQTNRNTEILGFD
jgi:hypothetical protein